MLVAVVAPYQAVNPHFEAELEILQRHLDAGDRVVYWACLGQQSLCDFNLTGQQDVCRQCEGRREMGLQLLSKTVPPGPIQRSPAKADWPVELPRRFQSLEELRAFRVDNFDIGYACLSSLVSAVRDPEPDLDRHGELLRQLLLNSWQVYHALRSRLARQRPDRVYVFNGRFATMRAVLRAAQSESVDCYIHERGATYNRYQLFENHLPHDLAAMERRILDFWQTSPDPWRRQAGAQWFIDRRHRVERGWKSFVKEQRPRQLPADWSPRAHNVVLFCSSEDEFAAIGDCWDQRPYTTQVAGVRHLLSLANRPDFRLTIRLHPNLKTAPRHLIDPFRQISDPRVSLILPESEIDSYALLDQATTVVSFGSSVGIEAVYHSKPSVLLGPCFYRCLAGTYQPVPADCTRVDRLPQGHPVVQQLADHLNRQLPPLDKEGALQYGLWMQENGIEYRYYRATDFNEGTFKQQLVYARPRPKSWKGKLRAMSRRWWPTRRPAA